MLVLRYLLLAAILPLAVTGAFAFTPNTLRYVVWVKSVPLVQSPGRRIL